MYFNTKEEGRRAMNMNSDFNFKRFQWKKLAALALCLALTLQSSAVFAASQESEEPAVSQEITLKAKKAGDVSGNATFKTSKTGNRYTYTGKAIKPKVIVTGATTGKKISASNYTVKYGQFVNGQFKEKTPKAVGAYYVSISFKGNCKIYPTRYLRYSIIPQKVTVKNVTAAKSGMKASWKKLGADEKISGYEIAWSTERDFVKADYYYWDYSSKRVGKNTSSASIKLEKGEKYYVRIRAYKTVKISSEYGYTYSDKIYGDWSKAKSVTVKK